MVYKREIDDFGMIQYIILYTMAEVKEAISYPMLINLVLENCNITYTNFQIGLSHLVETEHARTFDCDGMTMYELEEKGFEVNAVLYKKIPIYIREPISKAIQPLFQREREKNRIKSTITPVRANEFCAECGIYDDDRTPLLELSFYAGTREEASRLAENFSKNPEHIYGEILKLLTTTTENTED